MADPYRILAHPELGKQLKELAAAGREDPNGPKGQEFAAVKDGLNALRHGREAELGGKQFHALQNQYGDISDCAEVRIPVVREFAPNGYEFGPSHRLTYREFEGTEDDPTPVREVIAFEPRKDGRPFEVTADRLGRAVGVTLADVAPAQAQGNGNRAAPERRPLPQELAAAARAASSHVQSDAKVPAERPAAETSPAGVDAAVEDALLAQRLAAMTFGRPATEARQSSPDNGAATSGRASHHPEGNHRDTRRTGTRTDATRTNGR